MTGPVGVSADLDLVFAEVAMVRAVVDDPVAAADGDRVYDVSIGWGVALSGRLLRLEHYHRRGELSPADAARYAQLRAELVALAPAAARLGLATPPALGVTGSPDPTA